MSYRFGALVREIRIHLCQKSNQSAGVREYIQKHYVAVKTENPNIPILIRECSGVQPCIYARYEKGEERSTSLTNLSVDDVAAAIKKLVK